MRRTVLLWVSGLLVLTAIVIAAGWSAILESLVLLDWPVLVVLLLLQLVTLGLIAYQWQYILNRSNTELTFGDVTLVTLAGTFVESVTPSSKLGGEAAKVYLFTRLSEGDYLDISSALLVFKFVSMVPLLLLCLLAVIIAGGHLDIAIGGLASGSLVLILAGLIVAVDMLYARTRGMGVRGSLIVSGITWAFGPILAHVSADRLRTGRLARLAMDGYDLLSEMIYRAKTVLSTTERRYLYAVSLIVWGLYPLKVYIVALMLGLEVGLLLATVATFLAYGVSILPISPGGTGTFEGTLAVVFVIGGTSFAEGVTAALIVRLFTFWFPLLLSMGATIWLITSDRRIDPAAVGLDRLQAILSGR